MYTCTCNDADMTEQFITDAYFTAPIKMLFDDMS